MKTALLCSVAIMCNTTASWAQDGDTSRWEGFYGELGVTTDTLLGSSVSAFDTGESMDTAGFSSSGSSEFDLDVFDDLGSIASSGGDIELGYNWALSDGWVAGVGAEASFGTVTTSAAMELAGDSIDVNQNISSDGAASLMNEIEIDDQWALTGRFGRAVQPDAFVYGITGLAFGRAVSTTEGAICEDQQPCPAGTSDTIRREWTTEADLVGLVLGGGVEFALSRNWALTAEYRITKYGASETTSFSDSDCAGYGGDHCSGSTSFDLDAIQSVRIGIAYYFN